MVKEYVALLEPASDGTWSAYVPDLPGCVCSAPTSVEAATLIRDSIAYHIEGMRAHGDHVPEPTTIAERVSIP
jgi:predicted RNase H-like HicB family nuclease